MMKILIAPSIIEEAPQGVFMAITESEIEYIRRFILSSLNFNTQLMKLKKSGETEIILSLCCVVKLYL